MSRLACVLVSNFLAAVAVRSDPALRDRPLGIVTGAPPATRVIDANDAARERGVLPPMNEAEARTRCPGLLTRPASPEGVASARHALLEAAQAVSPRIEDAAPGLVFVDVAGLTRLFGDDAAVGARLIRLATRVGLSPRVGIAGTRMAARVAAERATARVAVVAPGEEPAVLAPAPLAVLALPDDVARTLARWGVTTLGELAALPRDGIADRLGPAGLRAHEQALGRDREPFRPYVPPPFWEEVQGLDWEIDTLPALDVALERVLGRLGQRLEAAHVATDALALQLGLASGARDDRTIPLAHPMVDVASMLIVLRTALEARPPEAAVVRIALSARTVPARPTPRGLWEPPAPAARDLRAVLARLVALVGVETVGAPRLIYSHRGQFEMGGLDGPPKPPALRRSATAGEISPRRSARSASSVAAVADEGRGEARIALRRVQPGRTIGVEWEAADERGMREIRPVRICLDGRAWTRVLAAAGPWRVSGEWWDVHGWARDEWDVALADGTLWQVARDHASGDWILEGLYD